MLIFFFRKYHVITFLLGNRLLFDLLLLIVLYLFGSSLCLYSITIFFFFQDGILSKVANLYLYKIQICVYQRQYMLTLRFGYDTITMLGGL